MSGEASTECVLVVANGRVISAVPLGEPIRITDPSVTESVRIPVAAAERFMLKPWPGRAAALAILAQEAGHVAG